MYNRATEMHPSFKNFVNSLADFVPKSEEEIEKTFYTAQEIEQHKTVTDAWVSYRGFVYDVSRYLCYHPGGVATMKSYLGYDICTGVKVHPFVKIEKYLMPLRIGKVKGDAQEPPGSKQLRVEHGQL